MSMYPESIRQFADQRRSLAPEQQAAFDALGKAVFADGALSAKYKQIVAVAVAHVTQCPYCIKGHTAAALRAGATPNELMEAVWVAAEMRAGGAYAHSSLMLEPLPSSRRGEAGRQRDALRCIIVARRKYRPPLAAVDSSAQFDGLDTAVRLGAAE